MGRSDSILGQFGETARCRDAQHGDGVCCAFTLQLVLSVLLLSRVDIAKQGIWYNSPSVRLLVCLSVIFVHCVHVEMSHKYDRQTDIQTELL